MTVRKGRGPPWRAQRRLIDEQSRIVDQAGRAAEVALMRMLSDDIDRYRTVNLLHASA